MESYDGWRMIWEGRRAPLLLQLPNLCNSYKVQPLHVVELCLLDLRESGDGGKRNFSFMILSSLLWFVMETKELRSNERFIFFQNSYHVYCFRMEELFSHFRQFGK